MKSLEKLLDELWSALCEPDTIEADMIKREIISIYGPQVHDDDYFDSMGLGEYETDQGVVIHGLKNMIESRCREYHEHMIKKKQNVMEGLK